MAKTEKGHGNGVIVAKIAVGVFVAVMQYDFIAYDHGFRIN